MKCWKGGEGWGGAWGELGGCASRPTHLKSPNFCLEVLYKPTRIDRQENQLNKDSSSLPTPTPPSPHT